MLLIRSTETKCTLSGDQEHRNEMCIVRGPGTQKRNVHCPGTRTLLGHRTLTTQSGNSCGIFNAHARATANGVVTVTPPKMGTRGAHFHRNMHTRGPYIYGKYGDPLVKIGYGVALSLFFPTCGSVLHLPATLG